VAAPLLLLLQRFGWRTPFAGPLHVTRLPVSRDNILGSVVFGAGWAIAGTCPRPAIAMGRTDSLPAVFLVTGSCPGTCRLVWAAKLLRWMVFRRQLVPSS